MPLLGINTATCFFWSDQKMATCLYEQCLIRTSPHVFTFIYYHNTAKCLCRLLWSESCRMSLLAQYDQTVATCWLFIIKNCHKSVLAIYDRDIATCLYWQCMIRTLKPVSADCIQYSFCLPAWVLIRTLLSDSTRTTSTPRRNQFFGWRSPDGT